MLSECKSYFVPNAFRTMMIGTSSRSPSSDTRAMGRFGCCMVLIKRYISIGRGIYRKLRANMYFWNMRAQRYATEIPPKVCSVQPRTSIPNTIYKCINY